MTIEEIKTAVDAGETVRWANEAYTVIKDKTGQYLIRCNLNDNYCGLTNKDGTELNGQESEFYIVPMHELLYGTDADNETSLIEYGLLVMPYTKDGNQDEYFCVYRCDIETYDTGYKREYELNDLINGKEWADDKEIERFLEFVDMTKEEWIAQSFVWKLADCLNYWGHDDIMGTCYNSLTEEQAKEQYLKPA